MHPYKFQQYVLDQTEGLNHVAYYMDMGLGKTLVGSEKMLKLRNKTNIIICQKSKVQDWIDFIREHFRIFTVYDLTDKHKEAKRKAEAILLNIRNGTNIPCVLVINYELAFRRKELLDIEDFTLMLDESQLIQNENAKRSKFILKMRPANVILLSGTPTSGKYEQLWSQIHLLGWNISKDAYWNTYVESEWIEDDFGFRHRKVLGYKNVPRLKQKLRDHGVVFMKLAEAGIDLPEQTEQIIKVSQSKEYQHFMKHSVVEFDSKTNVVDLPPVSDTWVKHVELVGDTILTKFLYARQLCGQYSVEKIGAVNDIIESTEERIIIFYNFNAEMELLKHLARIHNRPVSVVNGQAHDLEAYESQDDSITLVQYQAGAMGLNLQKAHFMIYFTLPFGKGSSAMWEQSRKRIHRIGQTQHCIYYYPMVENSIEFWNLSMLKKGEEYNEELFRKDCTKHPSGGSTGAITV